MEALRGAGASEYNTATNEENQDSRPHLDALNFAIPGGEVVIVFWPIPCRFADGFKRYRRFPAHGQQPS